MGLTNRQVEFASSDEVFPLSEELEEAGASDMLASSPPITELRPNRRVIRQSTVESINSTVAELMRQVMHAQAERNWRNCKDSFRFRFKDLFHVVSKNIVSPRFPHKHNHVFALTVNSL